MHLTASELHGLRAIVLYLHSLPPSRKNVPDILVNPVALIQDVRTIVEQHRKDQSHLAVTGIPVVRVRHLAHVERKKLPPYSFNITSNLTPKFHPTTSAASWSSTHQSLPSGSGLHFSVGIKKEENFVESEIKEHVAKSDPTAIVKKETTFIKVEEPCTSAHEDTEWEATVPLVKIESPFPHLRNQLRQQQEDLAKKSRQHISEIRTSSVGHVDPCTQRKKASGILLSQLSDKLDLVHRPEVLVPIFQHLRVTDLLNCMRVCRSWNRYSIDPSLWKSMDLSHRQLTSIMLAGIIRRQPRCLIMDWSSFSHQQCAWLMDRLPHLSTLSMQGCSATVLAALKLPSAMPSGFNRTVIPKLTVLDLSWVSGLNDIVIEKSILASPLNRLSNLKQLALAGSQLTDVTLAAIASSFPALESLCLAYCLRFSPHGLRSLLTSNNGQLQRIDLIGCTQLLSFDYPSLQRELLLNNPKLCLPDDITGDSHPIHRCLRIN